MNSFSKKSQRQSSHITFLLLLKSHSAWLSTAHCCQSLFSSFPSASLCPTISHPTGRELKGNKESRFEEPHQDPLDLKHALHLGDVKEPGLYGIPGMLAQPPSVPLVSKSRWRGVGPVTISAVLLVQRRILTPHSCAIIATPHTPISFPYKSGIMGSHMTQPWSVSNWLNTYSVTPFVMVKDLVVMRVHI